jgi:hypothetical protein
LQNVSNDCFANSVLQLLVHCAPLRDWFDRLLTVISDLESRDQKARVDVPPLVRAFAQLVHDYRHGVGQDDTLVSPWSPFAKPLPPLKLASRVVPTVMPGRKTVLEQQDAQEFLFLLLDSLHASILDAPSVEQDDPASNVYYFSDPEDDAAGESSSRANGKAASRSSESSAGRANGHHASSSSGGGSGGGGSGGGSGGDGAGASEEWTEIGPSSRKSVVITADNTWRDSPVSHLLRGRLRSTIKRRNAKSSISIEPFFALSLDPLLGATGAASAGGASALPDKRRPGADAPTTTLPHLLKSFLASERVATAAAAAPAAAVTRRAPAAPTRNTLSSRRCRRRCWCTLRASHM